MTKFIILTVCLILSISITAQIDKIDTDRPDQTESPFTIPKKWMQFEMGFLKQSDKYNSLSARDFSFQHPTLLSKYGVSKCAELRLITEYASAKYKTIAGYSKPGGISSVQLGGKINFFGEKGFRPKISLIAHYDFGSLRTFYYDSIDGANFRFSMQNTLSKTIALGYNIGIQWDRFGSTPAFIYTFAPGFNITEKWYTYIEAFGFIYKDDTPEHSIDGGVAYYVNDNFKLDISGGFGINKKAPDNYFAIGASFRFKTIK